MSERDSSFFTPEVIKTLYGPNEEEIRKLHERINRLELRVRDLEEFSP